MEGHSWAQTSAVTCSVFLEQTEMLLNWQPELFFPHQQLKQQYKQGFCREMRASITERNKKQKERKLSLTNFC